MHSREGEFWSFPLSCRERSYRLGLQIGNREGEGGEERENSNQAPIELLLISPGKGSISIHKLHSYINQIHWRLVSFARMEVSKSLRPA